MDIYIFERNTVSIEARGHNHRVYEYQRHVRLGLDQGGAIRLFINERQADQLRAALNVLYPPPTPIHGDDLPWEATVRYAEEHAGDVETVGHTNN